RRLQGLRPDARFVWVGDGPMRAALQRDNPDFVFTGVQRGELLARLFASADLFVFPSRSETFGNVTLEAMASGIATVAYDYGAAREHLRDGEHGAAIEPGDETAFLAAVARIGADVMAMRRMGRAARAAVAGLSTQRVAEDSGRLLASLAHGRPVDADRAAAELVVAQRFGLVPARQPRRRADRHPPLLRRGEPARRRRVLVRADGGDDPRRRS